jgi:4-amino-4-deoxy-L-arabinose transferase-like glycosyltransferase
MRFSHLVLLLLAALLFLSIGNGALPLIDRDEPRFAEASREMLERGDWVVPYFNNKYRFDKPPLIYWLQASSYRVLGQNEFAARFPSVLCAALTVVALAAWAARHSNPTTGARAAIIFLLNLQVFAHGRAAVADMAMVLFVTLASWSAWEAMEDPRPNSRKFWSIAFWGTLALGFLAKGPIALLPVVAAAVHASSAATHRPRWHFWLGGPALTLSLIGLWGIPALLNTHGAFATVGLGKHVVARTVAPMEGHGSSHLWSYLATLPLYFITLFPGMAPWSFWIPAALRHHWLRRSSQPLSRFLLLSSALIFAIFTLSRTKLPHYTLPAFPFLSLLLAQWWPEKLGPRTFQIAAAFSAAAGLLLATLGFPTAQRLFISAQIAHTVSPWLQPGMAFASVDYHEPSIVWSLRSQLKNFHEPIKERDALRWMSQPGSRLLILPSSTAQKLFPQIPPHWHHATTEGWHLVKGRKITLTALAKPE